MSRRARDFRDPTASKAFPEELLRAMDDVLHTVSEREARIIALRFGFAGRPRTLREVADSYGLTLDRVREIEQKVLQKFRHPSRGAVLRDFLGEDHGSVPEEIRTLMEKRFIAGPAGVESPRVFCDRHGWTVPDDLLGNDQVCAFCPCYLPPSADLGRPSVYCSTACRQAAYRRRRREQQQADVAERS